MCGIYCSFKSKQKTEQYEFDRISKLLNHRGPDSINYKILPVNETCELALLHTRLKINGDDTPQPLTDSGNTIYLIINGEIFNWKTLSTELDYQCTKSDCEVIIPLYKKYVRSSGDFTDFFNKINGQYSFVLYDSQTNKLLVARDHIGITPLYYTHSENGFAFCSELKGLKESIVSIFPPRSYMYIDLDPSTTLQPIKYLEYKLNKPEIEREIEGKVEREVERDNIKKDILVKLTSAIKLQFTDVENSVDYGVLLSGGLDSSIVASVISRLTSKKVKTFSIGITPKSPDLIAARKVANFLGTEHHEFLFTPEEGFNELRNVIWYTETYDTTTVRASTPMYLLTKKIKTKFPNLKVLFSGELSDELLCYLYGANAPNETEFQKETLRLVNNVHLFDCLRANKTCMANGVEVRVPFTDPDFVRYILNLHPCHKIFGKLNDYRTMEKQILRDSFCDYLPHDILYRKKEAFSDGVSSQDNASSDGVNWIDYLQNRCSKIYSVKDFFELQQRYCHYNVPCTKEQLYYRHIFVELFGTNNDHLVEYWKPRWCGNNPDPSARKHIAEYF